MRMFGFRYKLGQRDYPGHVGGIDISSGGYPAPVWDPERDRTMGLIATFASREEAETYVAHFPDILEVIELEVTVVPENLRVLGAATR